jgi:hypothetical protein
MNWNQQNQAGVSWNCIHETITKMWQTYWRTTDKDIRKKIEKSIVEFTVIAQKMSGIINSG